MGVKCDVFIGGIEVKKDRASLARQQPHVAVGTPGRLISLTSTRRQDGVEVQLALGKLFLLNLCNIAESMHRNISYTAFLPEIRVA